MSEHERVPMRRRTNWIGEDDVSLKIEPPLIGRRFTMDVSENVLAQFGAEAIKHCVERLGQEVAYRHQDEIHRMVAAAILDKAWALPIIEQELRRACREMVLSLWSDDEKKNLRDWFDLFTASLQK